MKRRLSVLSLSLLIIVGCSDDIVTGPVILPPSAEGNISPLPNTTTNIKTIYVEFQEKFDVNTAVMTFEPRGIIPGAQSPMVPLSTRQSDMQSLGFITHMSNNGEEALLQYNDSNIKFKVGEKSLYINDEPGIALVDAPLYNNGTMYIPIIPLLNALKIDYRVVGEDLIIGGMYTDDSGEPANTQQ